MNLLIFSVLFIALASQSNSEDLYELLGVPRDATVKEIRKAFKTLAVKLHPDKNQKDKDADSKFIKIASAYETLKDPDSRKHYDVHGDTGSDIKQQYHSYTYYRDEFGIYDDDPLITTLSRADYELNVLDTNQAWFVNFYSPNCHHCHELAPTWRKLATELEGVIRIAAVNCEDDWSLCYQLSIQSYPTLLYYEKESHLYEGIRYKGSRDLFSLTQFVLSKLTVEVKTIDENDLTANKPWLLFVCVNEDECVGEETRLKMAAILEGLMSVGVVTDRDLVKTVAGDDDAKVIYYKHDGITQPIDGSDTKEILTNVLEMLPNHETLNVSRFDEIRSKLLSTSDDESNPWLICFYLGTATDLNLQLKRLPSLIGRIEIGLVHCGKSAPLCNQLQIQRYPTWAVLKRGGAFELHHGRDVLHELSAFARDSVQSTNLHALSPRDFHELRSSGAVWFVDWYAPWCPPCKRLLPELRKASQRFESDLIRFGTVDCTLHKTLCTDENIRSYPTTVLYNGTSRHYFHGVPSEDGIVEFVSDMMNPIVLDLNESNFMQLMRKSKDELWVVDFFAPWCGPCRRLAPEWRRLAKQLSDFPAVKLAHVDCVANADLCQSQRINAYPIIRLFPLGTEGLNSVAIYNGNHDVVSMKRWILGFVPSPVIAMTSGEFRQQILTKRFILPWLVEFYAPWCGHCTHFEPEFRKVAQRLEGHVRSAKVDCESERVFCGNLRVNSYPTVILYRSPSDQVKIDSQNAADIIKTVEVLIEDNKRQSEIDHDEL